MGNGEYASTFVMSKLRDGLQGSDRDDNRASFLAKFCNRVGGNKEAADIYSALQDITYPESAKWKFLTL